jgi:phage head maturation protease
MTSAVSGTLLKARSRWNSGIGFAEVPEGTKWSADRQRVTRTRAALDHVAVVRVPAYAGAGVAGVRAGGQHGAAPTPALLTLLRRRG